MCIETYFYKGIHIILTCLNNTQRSLDILKLNMSLQMYPNYHSKSYKKKLWIEKGRKRGMVVALIGVGVLNRMNMVHLVCCM